MGEDCDCRQHVAGGRHAEGDLAHTLLWLYPAWVLLAGLCAWKAWSRSPELTWILIFITILAHGAMWLLCYPLQ